jgi:hypothetical protein
LYARIFPAISSSYEASQAKWSFLNHVDRKTLPMTVPSLHLSMSYTFITFSNYQN